MKLIRSIIRKIKNRTRKLSNLIFGKVAPVYWKEFRELSYWKKMKKIDGILSNSHFEFYYTTHFGLDVSFYNNKTILDIGCGPRGSLEWASNAFRRMGLDPLAKEYLILGANKHQMEYIDSSSENIPLRNAECHAVFSFNSLDHVEDVEKTIKEIKRVVCSGGVFLLLVEVNHPPTICEPHQLTSKKLIDSLKPEFICDNLQVYKLNVLGMYQSIQANEKIIVPIGNEELGYLSAKFIRQ